MLLNSGRVALLDNLSVSNCVLIDGFTGTQLICHAAVLGVTKWDNTVK